MLKSKLLKAGLAGKVFLILMVSPSISTTAKDLLTRNAPVFFADSFRNVTDSLVKGTVEDCEDEISESQLPQIRLNDAARKYVVQFMAKNKEDLVAIEKRSDRFFKIIEPILVQYGIPAELKYLAVVESQLKTNATSKVGAKGLWQFMPQTARELGLKLNGKYDERTHAHKSTVAAAKYLRYLYSQFGDWLLVIAAYNSGPGYVYAAIKKSGSRNFWHLQKFLPAETRSHVKRYIGTHIYFQEEASLTVLTKQETVEHTRAVEAYALRQRINTEVEIVVQAHPNVAVDLR